MNIMAAGLAAAMLISTVPKPAAEYPPLEAIPGHLYAHCRCTHYCPCEICCGPYAWSGTTASGSAPEEGITVAAPPDVPFGTKIMINGHEYTVQDRGGGIQYASIDIYCNTHSEALEKGCYYADVFIEDIETEEI